jgi:hypothetical protein
MVGNAPADLHWHASSTAQRILLNLNHAYAMKAMGSPYAPAAHLASSMAGLSKGGMCRDSISCMVP